MEVHRPHVQIFAQICTNHLRPALAQVLGPQPLVLVLQLVLELLRPGLAQVLGPRLLVLVLEILQLALELLRPALVLKESTQ